jgi:two-component system, OmpR family, sensor histidine kinase KdpD
LTKRVLRLVVSLAGVTIITLAARAIAGNSTTAGFAYLLLVLVLATTWGFLEAAVASIAATLSLNFFFLPPVGTFTIEDPQNWVALFSFLATALVASRLSTEAKRRALDAIERQQDIERLYTFSRAILLIGNLESFPAELVRKLQETFQFSAAVLYDRRTGEFHRAGPGDIEALDDRLRDAAIHGTAYSDPQSSYTITAIHLGSEPIASLAIQDARKPDSVLQGIANLVAIGLERARAQDLAHQIEAARQSERLRTTLIDAMAHEFKTPLTSIKAATTSLLDNPDQPPDTRKELLKVADEEADHLRILIDDTVEMARLDTAHIKIHPEQSLMSEVVKEVVNSMHTEIDRRPIEIAADAQRSVSPMDRRLIRLALKQLLDNALKYSYPRTPISIRVFDSGSTVTVEITNRGQAISPEEQSRIFDRFYRNPDLQQKIPGSGLGLTIAQSIVRAHKGDLAVTSRPGENTFQMTLPSQAEGGSL